MATMAPDIVETSATSTSGTSCSYSDSQYSQTNGESGSSFAEEETPFAPADGNSLMYPAPAGMQELTPVTTDDTYSIGKTLSRMSRTESLFKGSHANGNGPDGDLDDYDDDVEGGHAKGDVKAVLTRSSKKITLVLTSRQRTLLRESWSLILNDDLTSADLHQFARRTRLHDTDLKTCESHESDRSSSTTTSRSESLDKLQHTVLRDTDFNRREYDDTNISKSLFCTQFYENLVALDPHIQHSFPTIRHQAVSFAMVLDSAIRHLDDIESIDARLRSIGKRHTRILGIDNTKFEVMGQAFVVTLRDRLGKYLTTELERTWSRVYSYLADTLLVYGVDPVLHRRPSVESQHAPDGSLSFYVPQVVQEVPPQKAASPSPAPSFSPTSSARETAPHTARTARTQTKECIIM